jgi:rSAM/selenodomain-associated transferase 1
VIIKRLGIFVRSPVAGEVKTRLVPPLDPSGARDLYAAFLGDLVARLRESKLVPTVFVSGDRSALESRVPPRWPLVPQADGDLGARLSSAFAHLLDAPGARAVIIGSDSPDLPVAHIKRAFQRLKHRDVVLGPAADGGYYLVGLRRPAPALFEGISWGTPAVLAETADAIARAGLSLSLLPLWYDVDDARSLELLEGLCRARRVAGAPRFRETERALEALRGRR